MNGYRWIPAVAALVLAAIVGVMAYNAGVAHGIAQSGKIVMPPGGPYPYYGWHPWGPGFFFAPFLFIIFGVVMLRALFGAGRWRHARHCGYHALDEWHRQAHERMWNDPSSPAGAAGER